MKFIDLFCGLGGASYGATSLGLEPVLLVDYDPDVIASLHRDLAEHFVRSDLRELSDDILQVMQEAQVLLCSPPCQSYSRLKTKNSTAIVADDDKKYASVICRAIENSDFDTILIENVPTFLESGQGTAIIDALLRKGLYVCAGVYDAVSFGVPQRRKRSVILASKKSNKIAAVSGVACVRDAFEGLPRLNTSDELHYSRSRHSKVVQERIASIPKDGGSRSSLPPHLVLECHKNTSGYRDIYGRMSWEKPSPTITSGCTNPSKGRFLHPQEDRAITLREAARLQTLPDSVTLGGGVSLGKKAQMIGNAFPSRMVAKILEQVL